METVEILDQMEQRARADEALRARLLATKNAKDPMREFCKIAGELGYELYVMDLVAAGEEFYAAMLRSTNGGGENSPKLEGEDDFYELFLTGLTKL